MNDLFGYKLLRQIFLKGNAAGADEDGGIGEDHSMVKVGISEREGRLERACSFVEKRFDQKRLIHDMESLYVELVA